MAAEYYKIAADRDHSEAKLNYRRCLRLLDRWEGSDRSSEAVSHSPSVDHLFDIFQAFLENPESLDDDCCLLLRSFESLKAKTEFSVVLTSPSGELLWNEIVRGNTSDVTLLSDSNCKLTAVKTL
jgi:hypothetical protein